MPRTVMLALVLLAECIAPPAFADVKAGVAAWMRGDYAKAIEEWRGPAIAGDADAQFNMGQAYKLGRGVPADLAAAQEWYRKAAVQGHVQAGDNYGLALFGSHRRDQAVEWLEKSAARGEPRTQYVLGTMYFNGEVVKRDFVRAYALMTRASDAGITQATTLLTQMNRYVSVADRERGTAIARQFESATPATRSVSEPPVRAASESLPVPIGRSVGKDGLWRVQLGSFRDIANAHALFATLQRKGAVDGLQRYLEPVGVLTRLQAGPFATKGVANAACPAIRRAGGECVVLHR